MRCRETIAAIALVALCAREAHGEGERPNVSTRTPATCTTDGGTTFRVPPGRFTEQSRWIALDSEMRRLQGAEIVLTAENRSLRESAAEPDGVGWRLFGVVVLLALGGGFVAGAAL
jgi:hypothetical protein